MNNKSKPSAFPAFGIRWCKGNAFPRKDKAKCDLFYFHRKVLI